MSTKSLDELLSDVILKNDENSLDDTCLLLERGASPNSTTPRGEPVLLCAVINENVSVVEALLKFGADPNHYSNQAMSMSLGSVCEDYEIGDLLLRYGANLSDFDDGDFDDSTESIFARVTGAARIPERRVSDEKFATFANPRFGKTNPERFEPDFWIEQIRTGTSGFRAGRNFSLDDEQIALSPIWSFHRFGRSATLLPDGRRILIAGEHEDSYDDDFYIYNDVTVLDGKGGVEHFIYPKSVFPPTDFHSATLLEDHILLIGSLGYNGERRMGETQVLRLNLIDLSIEPIETSGAAPGWISRHTARLDGQRIIVEDGKIDRGTNYEGFVDKFSLDTCTFEWRCIQRET